MSESEELAKQIEGLAPSDQLRLAADLLERRKATIAYAIISRVKAEIGAHLSFLKANGFE